MAAKLVEHNDALIGFREASVLRGPSMAEFAEAMGLAGTSSSQGVFLRLEEIGWIAKAPEMTNHGTGYVLTPAGERRYRELKPDGWRGPTWPID